MENELKDKRLMRLTWNTNNWQYPSGHKWKKASGSSSKPFENQHGYGHEEWLFNSRFNLNGYQYGDIRGADSIAVDVEDVDELHLYTIDPETKDRYLVGVLRNVEIISEFEEKQKIVSTLFEDYKEQMLSELRAVGADAAYFANRQFEPSVKFKMEEADIYSEPILANQLKHENKFNRFQPYIIDDELEALISSAYNPKINFVFTNGEAISKGRYKKVTVANEALVVRTHTDITKDLSKYLKKEVNIEKENISIEKTRVGNTIVDVAVKEGNQYSFFEVKTNSKASRNIRQAIGQLLEYALMDAKTSIRRLVIVGPAGLDQIEQAYFKSLQKSINFPLEYWAYTFNKHRIADKFKVFK